MNIRTALTNKMMAFLQPVLKRERAAKAKQHLDAAPKQERRTFGFALASQVKHHHAVLREMKRARRHAKRMQVRHASL